MTGGDAPGRPLPARTIGPITRTDVVRYAGAGGDLNPVHHDDEAARAAGAPGAFAMGLLPGGLVAQTIAEWVGADAIRTLRLRFTGRVWPGDVLRVEGQLADPPGGGAAPRGERLRELRAVARRPDGEAVLEARATVRASAPAGSGD